MSESGPTATDLDLWRQLADRANAGPGFSARFIADAREAIPAMLAALVAERERADALQRERDRLASAYDDARFAYDTEREGGNELRARVSAAEDELDALRGARELHDLCNGGCVPGDAYRDVGDRLSAAEAALTRTRKQLDLLWRWCDRNIQGGVPPVVRDAVLLAAVADTTREPRPTPDVIAAVDRVVSTPAVDEFRAELSDDTEETSHD